MITVGLKGGLANQMFQIAALVNVAVQNRVKFGIDPKSWPAALYGGAHMNPNQEMIYAVDYQAHPAANYTDTVYRRLPIEDLSPESGVQFSGVYQERAYAYTEIGYFPGMILEGYFQSEKYFKPSEGVVRKVFAPPPHLKDLFTQTYRHEQETLISVHVRRGAHYHNWKNHGALTADYYREAMKMFDLGRFLVFSDDIPWCKKNLKGDHVEFVENKKDYEDLYYMSFCDHHIIANSSFGWWGAWLNDNEDKVVVCPEKWYGPSKNINTKDLIPESWIRIPNQLEGPDGIV